MRLNDDLHHFRVADLEESVIDMLACRWERTFGGDEMVTAIGLSTVEDIFLQRYTPNDRLRVLQYLENVRTSEH